MGVRHVDENNLSHHFLEEVAHTQGPLGSQGPGGGDSSRATTSQGTLRMSLSFGDSSLQSDPRPCSGLCSLNSERSRKVLVSYHHCFSLFAWKPKRTVPLK